jgi:hypothetical protein
LIELLYLRIGLVFLVIEFGFFMNNNAGEEVKKKLRFTVNKTVLTFLVYSSNIICEFVDSNNIYRCKKDIDDVDIAFLEGNMDKAALSSSNSVWKLVVGGTVFKFDKASADTTTRLEKQLESLIYETTVLRNCEFSNIAVTKY